MLLVKTKLEPSPVHGIGCFADQFIPKGTLVRKFMPGFDLEIPKSEVDKLPDAPRERFLNYAYFFEENNSYFLDFDDERFVNHSDEPNVGPKPSGWEELGEMYALRDIQIGEEITEDYKEFNDNAYFKIAP